MYLTLGATLNAGEGAPLDELWVDEQRAGASSVMRCACADASNEADQQRRGSRGRKPRATRALWRARRRRIARGERGLRACATYPRFGGAGRARGRVPREALVNKGAPGASGPELARRDLGAGVLLRGDQQEELLRLWSVITDLRSALDTNCACSASPPPRRPASENLDPRQQVAPSGKSAGTCGCSSGSGRVAPQERRAGVAAPRRRTRRK